MFRALALPSPSLGALPAEAVPPGGVSSCSHDAVGIGQMAWCRIRVDLQIKMDRRSGFRPGTDGRFRISHAYR